jgi:membrane-bound ClpP family serine protease
MLDIETSALEQAIAKAVNEGPLFILLEIDTPGGRTDFAQRICAAIAQRQNCQVIAFIKGGKYAGALSAGAAVVLACDKIYIANNTTIGAAAGITFSKIGWPQDLKQAFGETVSEKFTSAWRAYFASLAERNNRPGLLAKAMADKDIEVIEVHQDQKRLFIDPVNKTDQQKIVRTWSKKGSLLTLTADEAVNCGMADQVINSRRELLQYLKAVDAEIIINNDVQQAAKEFQRAKLKFNRIKKSLDLKVKQSSNQQTKPRALRLLRGIRNDYNNLVKLSTNYPDLQVDVQLLQRRLNSVEAMYQKVKRDSE